MPDIAKFINLCRGLVKEFLDVENDAIRDYNLESSDIFFYNLERIENFCQIPEDYIGYNKLKLAYYLFSNNTNGVLKYENIMEDLTFNEKFYLFSCAAYNKPFNPDFIKIAIKNLTYEDIRNDPEYAYTITENLDFFKFFVENSVLKDAEMYPGNFYNPIYYNNIEIFKYMIESKNLNIERFNDMVGYLNLKSNPEIVEYLLQIPETRTFLLEDNFIFLRNTYNEAEERNGGDSPLSTSINDMIRNIVEYNNRFRIFENYRLNDEFRDLVFNLTSQIDELEEINPSLYVIENQPEDIFGQLGNVLINKNISDIAKMKKILEDTKKDFYLKNVERDIPDEIL